MRQAAKRAGEIDAESGTRDLDRMAQARVWLGSRNERCVDDDRRAAAHVQTEEPIEAIE